MTQPARALVGLVIQRQVLVISTLGLSCDHVIASVFFIPRKERGLVLINKPYKLDDPLNQVVSDVESTF